MRSVEVVAALISAAGEVLVQKRPQGKARAALWEFPGGKLEPSEEPRAALARECLEELGIEVEIGDQVWETHHLYDDLDVYLRLLRARIVSGNPEPREGQEIQWLAPKALLGLEFVAADVPVLDLLASGEIAL